jgi:hypothetical protein
MVGFLARSVLLCESCDDIAFSVHGDLSPPKDELGLPRHPVFPISSIKLERVRWTLTSNAGHRSCVDARNQPVALHPSFHLFLALPLLWLYQKAEGIVVELTVVLASDGVGP